MAASPANAANAHASASAGTSRASVLLPLPLDVAYDYRVPEGMAVEPGCFVEVPLGGRAVIGVVWEGGDPAVAEGRLRPVARRLDAPPMMAPLRRLIDWVAAYTLAPRGAVLRMAMSMPEALEPPRLRTGLVTGGAPPARLTPARARVLALAADGVPREAPDLAREAAVGPAVVRGLLQAGALAGVPLPARVPFRMPDADHAAPRLSPDQQAAADDLGAKVRDGAFSVTLLDGVTGSGKTEVYFAAVAAALAAGRQALVLLPEIALGSQWLERFVARFGTEPAPWHSELTMATRRHVWRAVAEGRAPVVVGARSALFLPFPDLGLVVVDEEHDASYKQEEGVIYHARDMAVVRARMTPCPAVLVSATPSLETVANVQDGRYGLRHLPDRHGGASLPAVSVLDMRREGPPDRRHWLAPRLIAAVESSLAGGEQAMLFLNRRGYAPLTLCRHCGHRFECPNCSAWLVEHRLTSRLQCHHCGFAMPLPEACPSCGTAGRLAPCGPGVERLAEEAAARWPDARLAVMASDTIESPRAAADLVRRMTEREIDLLIGTQIVAKGHHFPWLTLVGVVDADLGLAGGDLRAAERTYQLLHQVSGRAGRAERAGQVVLQTYMPEHKVLQALASGDRDRFVEAELDERRHHLMPPFGRLAALIVSGVGEERVRRTAAALARAAPREPGVETLGPAPAPMSLLRGRTRWRLLLKAPRGANVQRILRAWVERVKVPSAVRVQVDVDPYSFL